MVLPILGISDIGFYYCHFAPYFNICWKHGEEMGMEP